jgi:uncharacterized protein YbaR (Trm112 family)
MIDKKLLSILVCPVSKAALDYVAEQQELICWTSGLAYPIRDGIPVMLENEARTLSLEEKEKYLAEKDQHQATHAH